MCQCHLILCQACFDDICCQAVNIIMGYDHAKIVNVCLIGKSKWVVQNNEDLSFLVLHFVYVVEAFNTLY